MIPSNHGIMAGKKNTYVPGYTESFSNIVSHYNLVKELLFGSARVATETYQVAITDISDLAEWFNPQSANAGAIKINKEWQDYPPIFNNTNHHFASDALELTATLEQPDMYPQPTMSPTTDVTYSRVVPVADTSAIRVGQVCGIVGSKQYDNIHRTRVVRVVGTPAEGDYYNITFAPARDKETFPSTLLTATAGPSSTLQTMAADMVAQINVNSVLQSIKVSAYLLPDTPGCFAITHPKVSLTATDDYGLDGKGSLRNVGMTLAKSSTGITAYQIYQNVYALYVVAKTANSITFNWPLTITTSDVLSFSPTLMLSCKQDSFNTAVIPVASTDGVEIGQYVQISYQDNNLRTVISKTADTLTLSANVFVGAGLFVTVYPGARLLSSAGTTNGTTLTFASVPDSVKVGMAVYDYFASGWNKIVRVVSKTATTVVVDTPVSGGTGTTWVFYPAILSGQAWSRFRFMPEAAEDQTMIAMEFLCQTPNAADLSAWPAWWLFTDTSDPNPGAGSGSTEIDMMDMFTYWNNDSTNNYLPTSSTATDLYTHPDFANGSLTGNNTGWKERKLQFVWKADRAYFYIDDVLIRVRAITYNQYKRAQFAMNLAMGSMQTSFHSNGFFPIDFSRLPMKFRVKSWKFWFAPTDVPFENY